jgi:hypothetical protein
MFQGDRVMKSKKVVGVLCLLVAMIMVVSSVSAAKKIKQQLPDPDGKPADMTKPVQVYILMGQSNMLGAGKIKAGKKGGEKAARKAAKKGGEKAVTGDKSGTGTLEHATKEKGLYPYLIDDAGKWTVRNDVRNVRVMQSKGKMKLSNNEFMTIKGQKIGPEYGIGHVMGHVTDAPVMILKSCIGNRSLGWDLLPPGSKRFEAEVTNKKTKETKTFVFAGYKDSPSKWEKGTEPERIRWYAGKQYDDDIANAKKVLAELDKHYPGAKKYEVAGFFFWQGDKDRYNAAHSSRYEQNLVQLINQLRKDFNAPEAKFVCATLGQTKKDTEGNEGAILKGQLAVDGKSGKYPQFKGNVATVYTNPLSKGGASNSHYGGNAETYMDVGQAMGWAMAELLQNTK